jgi:cytochrome bd-type quinol oxidase subunit 1
MMRPAGRPGDSDRVSLDLARWQFALASVNHFFFVPVTIGLAFLTALLQTAWYRTKQDGYLRRFPSASGRNHP